jgi:hypothetical protein
MSDIIEELDKKGHKRNMINVKHRITGSIPGTTRFSEK